MAGDLTDDLQAAAARMGLPPLEFRTPLAWRIQAGDVQDLVTGYMDLLAEYQARDRLCTVGRLLQLSYFASPFARTCEREFGHVGHLLANAEEGILGLRVAGEILLPQEIPLLVCEFLAWSAYVADLDLSPPGAGNPWQWVWRRWPSIYATRRETLRALQLPDAPGTRVWFLDVLDAAFEAGWTRRPGIHHGLPLDPPPGTDTPWIKLAAIDPGDLAAVKRFAAKLRRAGVTVPEPPTAQAAA
ncbi:hypothetical protein [Tsukamurella paurometabola]|uniref:Uncharacterized protein n=1 Tax=Tsukamurella paurometabola TaxID=2061 RepID=A0ABS5NEV0_TSUPA|nr:hypothetical protein [Tsukamurella paurometabola]MBS4102763.1 hypothetical protein [Tsukamurella paurometabola]